MWTFLSFLACNQRFGNLEHSTGINSLGHPGRVNNVTDIIPITQCMDAVTEGIVLHCREFVNHPSLNEDDLGGHKIAGFAANDRLYCAPSQQGLMVKNMVMPSVYIARLFKHHLADVDVGDTANCGNWLSHWTPQVGPVQ